MFIPDEYNLKKFNQTHNLDEYQQSHITQLYTRRAWYPHCYSHNYTKPDMAETDNTPVQTSNGQENVSALEKDIIRQV